ncbi:hypothetical protein CVT24_007642, partial [Panaeolus cyanescens]
MDSEITPTTIHKPIFTEDLAYAETSETIHKAEDIRKIKQLLSIFFPTELVDIIAREAELWLCVMLYQHYGQSEYFSAASMTSPHFDTHRCLALTRKLSDMIQEESFIVQRIKFTVLSCDQGWLRGVAKIWMLPFEASWTWFEAKVVRTSNPSEEANLDQRQFEELQYAIKAEVGMGTNVHCTTVKNPYASPEGQNADPHATEGRGDSWTIVRNRRGNSEYRRHTVVWDRADVFDREGEIHRLNTEGKGQGCGFISALEMNDRIAVVSRAKPACWLVLANLRRAGKLGRVPQQWQPEPRIPSWYKDKGFKQSTFITPRPKARAMAATTPISHSPPISSEDLAYADSSEQVYQAADIKDIRKVLASFFPTELIDIIAHDAELWACVVLYQNYGSGPYEVIAKD